MKYAYYHADCPTCKNHNLLLVESFEVKHGVKIDKRYIYVLPDIWGEEAKKIATPLPFIVNLDTMDTLHVDYESDGMSVEIENFILKKH